jgi:hypothetical protein
VLDQKNADRDGVRSRLLRSWVVVLGCGARAFQMLVFGALFVRGEWVVLLAVDDLEAERLLDRAELEEKVGAIITSISQ